MNQDFDTPDAPQAALRDARTDFNVVFIHSRLDDYGLPPPVFRIYAHIARRAGNGDAYPAIATMARTCLVHPQTARRAIQLLTRHGLITREPRPGAARPRSNMSYGAPTVPKPKSAEPHVSGSGGSREP